MHEFQFGIVAPAQPPKPFAPPLMPEVLRPPPALAHTFQFFAAPLVTPPAPAPIKPPPLFPQTLPGPPHLAHTIPFFAGPTANSLGAFPGFGPAGAATFALALEPGAKLTYSWGTDIFKSYSGLEQRSNTTGPRPRQRIEGNAYLLDADDRTLRANLQRAASSGSTFLIALPYEELTLTADSVGTTVTVASTTQADWAIVTQRVLVWGVDDTVTQAVIQAVTATTIRLDVAPAAHAGSRIMPLLAVLLEPQQGFSRYAVNAGLWSIRALANAFGWVGQDSMGAGALITTYNAGSVAPSAITEDDFPIWDRPNLIEGTAPDSMISLAEIVDLGGLPFGIGSAPAPDWARPIKYSSADPADFQWLKAFLRLVLGRQRAFLLPTNRADLVFVSKSGTTLTITTDGDYMSWYTSLAHRRLALTRSGAPVAYVAVTAPPVDNHDGTLSLTLDTIVGGTVTMVSFAELVRFDNSDSDDFAIPWNGGVFSVDLVARVVQQ